MAGVEEIDGSVLIEADRFVASDPVRDLGPLRHLVAVTGSLRIEDADSIRSLDGLSSLVSVGDNFYIGRNDNLLSLAPLRNVRHCGLAFFVQDNDRLKSLDGLQGLGDVEGNAVLQIALNDSLETLLGLGNLRTHVRVPHSTDCWIAIVANPRLRSLEGLERLQRVVGLRIGDNNALEDIDALRGLRVAHELVIGALPALRDLSALAGMESCSTLRLGSLPVSSLAPLQDVSIGSIDLRDLPIEDFSAFARLVALQELWIERLPLVNSFRGLERLERLERLSILDSPSMTSLQGLDGPRAMEFVRIAGNRHLCPSVIDLWLSAIQVANAPMIENNGECPDNPAPEAILSVHRTTTIRRVSARFGVCNR